MIDFDNVTMGIRSDLQNQLRRLLNSEIIKGKVAVQRAYADWRRYPQYIVPLSEASIDLIFAPAFGSNKKNATDIRLAIDALELVFTRPEIGTFILLSGDSDFSSLVLKLKEYGKYIIGVGIRESSSDLLIQNCDEYYSYTEVTGLTREGEDEGSRRDAWELVVEAVSQMKREDDVMRSDRLKQVMQTIDPNFDEKDAGFSRFSKFVVEAGRRGLLFLEKMENGQYAIDVGTNANVPPEEEEELRKAQPAREPAARTRRKRPRRKEPEADHGGLTLAAAFDLLRQTLAEFPDAGEAGAAAEDVYARMKEVQGDPDDPMFERPRFQRMLRQAHDAQVIELAKVENTYRLKPGAAAVPTEAAGDDGSAAPRSSAEQPQPRTAQPAEASSEGDEEEAHKPSRGRSRSQRKRAPKRESAEERGEQRPARPEPDREAGGAATRGGQVQPQPSETGKGEEPKGDAAAHKRNPRFRRGSRGSPASRSAAGPAAEPSTPKKVDSEERAPAAPAPSAKPAASDSGAHRTVRTRRGSRGRGRSGKSDATGTGGGEPSSSAASGAAPESGTPSRQSASAASKAPAAPPEKRAAEPAPAAPAPEAPRQGSLFESSPPDEGSLFRRMTAALQRVVRGPDSGE